MNVRQLAQATFIGHQQVTRTTELITNELYYYYTNIALLVYLL